MKRRNFWLLPFCALLVFAFSACSHETDEENWHPYTVGGTYRSPYYRMVLENSGFVVHGYCKGWCETTYDDSQIAKIRFTITDVWTNGAWQSFPGSEVYNFSGSYETFTLSGNGALRGTYERVNTSKPVKLDTSAPYQATVDKLDEIIAYCDNNPGPANINNTLKLAAESKKTGIALLEPTWNSVGVTHILAINVSIIEQLQ